MTAGSSDWFPKDLQTLFTSGAIGGLDDGALLERFVAGRDEAAFEILVARHGPMVLRVCRAALADPHDADDAFQAVFLVLVRKAAAIRSRASVANWLFGVASRITARAKVDAARRHKHEQQAARRSPATPVKRVDEPPELASVLHEELARLPDRYREALVLCYFEGDTCDAAAARLRRPVGTVKARLSRARGIMKQRLLRRGVNLPAGMLAAAATIETARAAIPQELVNATVSAATRLAAGATSPAVSARILLLAEGVVKSMLLQKIKIAAALAFPVIIAAGMVLVAWGASDLGNQHPAKAEIKADEPPVAAPVAGTPEDVFARAIAALDQDRVDDFVAALHSEDVKRIRTHVAGWIGPSLRQGEGKLEHPAFPGVKSVEELEKLEDRPLVAQYLRGQILSLHPLFKLTLGSTGEVLGHVEEGTENVYVVYRSTIDETGEIRDRLQAIRLRKDGRRWAIQLPRSIEIFLGSFVPFGHSVRPMVMAGDSLPPTFTREALDARNPALDEASRFEFVGRLLAGGDTAHIVLREITPNFTDIRVLTVKKSDPGWEEALAGKSEALARLARERLRVELPFGGRPRFARRPETAGAPRYRAHWERPAAAAVSTPGYVDNEPQSKTIRARLEMGLTLKYPNPTPLERVVSDIAKATKGWGPNNSEIPIYVDPAGLDAAEQTMDSPVVIDVEKVPLKDILPRLLSPLGLDYCVRDGLLIISEPELIDQEYIAPITARDNSPGSKAILARLAQPVALKYPDHPPLERVIADIVKATRGPNDVGLRIYFDTAGMTEGEKTLSSPVTIDLAGIPLRTTLRLVLGQLGLSYSVHDGLLIVSEPDDIDRELERTPAVALDWSPGTLAILTRLGKPIAMDYPNDTPLEQVVVDITRATRDADDAGIRIDVEPTGLEAVEETMQSPIRLTGLKDIPLRTTLRLVLNQLGLGYVIQNGRLTITDRESVSRLKGEQESRKPVLVADRSLTTRAVLIRLEQANALMSYTVGVPLTQVISDINPTGDPNESIIPVHVDPLGLEAAGQTMTSPVWYPDSSAPLVSLRVSLRRILGTLGLDYYVRDGLLIISEPTVIDAELKKTKVIARDMSPGTRTTLTLLEQPIALKYPSATPLERVLADIASATKGLSDRGIPVHVDPAGLIVARKTMASPVAIDLEGIPLRTTLQLALRPLGLDYYVDAGRLIISDDASVQAMRTVAANDK